MADIFSTAINVGQAVSGLASLAFGASGGVVLDTFAFNGFEVPEYISIPGSQQLIVHKLVGGERVIDAMGDDPGDISWSGTFIDGNPTARAQQLEQMRSIGKVVGLQWGQFYYTVVIRSFEAKTYYSRVQYSIACAVLHNGPPTPPRTTGALASGGLAGALKSIAGGIGQAADAVHSVVAVAAGVIGGVQQLASAVGLHIGVLGRAQDALGVAGGLSAEIGGVAGFYGATTNSAISALSAGSAASYGGSNAMGGVVSGISDNAPTGQLVGSSADLQTATYAAGAQAQMQQAGDYSGAAAVSMTATAGGNPATAVANTAPAAYVNPTPLVASSGPPNSSLAYTSNTTNNSGDPSQGAFMTKSVNYGSNGAATTTTVPQPAVAGQLNASDLVVVQKYKGADGGTDIFGGYLFRGLF